MMLAHPTMPCIHLVMDFNDWSIYIYIYVDQRIPTHARTHATMVSIYTDNLLSVTIVFIW